MEVIQIFLSGIIATSLMTLFSYTISGLSGFQFREPQLLNELIHNSNTLAFNPGKQNPAGWIIHYSIGIFFVFIFNIIWNFTTLEPGISSGAFLGLIFGFIGITGWKIMFFFNPSPPKINFTWFYIQLLAAHIVFGIGASLVFL